MTVSGTSLPHQAAPAMALAMQQQQPRPVSFSRPSDRDALLDALRAQRLRRHKLLPHPLRDRSQPQQQQQGREPASDNPNPTSQSVPGRAIKPPLLRSVPSGPDLPPTPPAPSRNSSSSHSARPSSPTYVDPEPADRDQDADTPSNQKSPPTPARTPDKTTAMTRPGAGDRIGSKGTTESRSESFRTAPEDPCSSPEDDASGSAIIRSDRGRAYATASALSARTSQSTVRPSSRLPRPVGLGLGLSLDSPVESATSPRELFSFDDEGSVPEVEKEWDDNLERNVVVRKRRPQPGLERDRTAQEVVEDRNRLVAPTNATRALRGANPHEKMPPPPQRYFSAPSRSHSHPQHPINPDPRRLSSVSTHSSAVSTVVEAILVDSAPRQLRTLRHVRKNGALRDLVSDRLATVAASSCRIPGAVPRPRPAHRPDDRRYESYASTTNSISSRSARKEVWRNGGIPVVIVPGRQSSTRRLSSSGDGSRPASGSRDGEQRPAAAAARPDSSGPPRARPPPLPPLTRRGRRLSDSDRSQHTIDIPPVIPRRSSSLSAPTSCNTSRAGSVKDESMDGLNGQNALQIHLIQPSDPRLAVESPDGPAPPPPEVPEAPPTIFVRRPTTSESGRESGHQLSVQDTPFSMASFDTTGTVITNLTSTAELSRATAVDIFPHRNTSVLIVDHAGQQQQQQPDGPSQPRQGWTTAAPPVVATTSQREEMPVSRAVEPDEDPAYPVTPPQQHVMSMDDVDSPLRNPRAPPQPPREPALAAPPGTTPAVDVKRGAVHTSQAGQKPPPLSGSTVLRRAFSLTKRSDNPPLSARPAGLLRTLSLTRSVGRSNGGEKQSKRPDRIVYPRGERPPPDADRLYNFSKTPSRDETEAEGQEGRRSGVQQVRFRLPPPKLSLGARMKRTFSIFPRSHSDSESGDDEDHYYDDYDDDDDYDYDNDENGTNGTNGEGAGQYHELHRPPTRHAHADAHPGGGRARPTERQDPIERRPHREGESSPDRREIRRTASGNLRVVQRRPSLDSPLRSQFQPYVEATDQAGQKTGSPWRRRSLVDAGESTGIGIGLGGESGNGYVSTGGILPDLAVKLGQLQDIPRRLSERRRQKRTQELRQKISGPTEFRDGVQEVLRQGPSSARRAAAATAAAAPVPSPSGEVSEMRRRRERERELLDRRAGIELMPGSATDSPP